MSKARQNLSCLLAKGVTLLNFIFSRKDKNSMLRHGGSRRFAYGPKRKRYSSELENPLTIPRKSPVVSST